MKVKEIITPNNVLAMYKEHQEEYPGYLLLYRVGDRYECYEEDAETCGRVINLIVSVRKEPRIHKVASFPYHALDVYLRILLHNKIRVAVTKEIEDQ